MRVLTIMLSSGLGGIESAFHRCALMLRFIGHETVCCTTPGAAILSMLPDDIHKETLRARSQYDPCAVFAAWRLIRRIKPDVVITHGKRAYLLFVLLKAAGVSVTLVNVLHRHRFKQIGAADIIIGVSRTICREAINSGIDAARVVHIPNFIPVLPVAEFTPFRLPPVIGFMGRFVPEKGLGLFLEALALLKSRNIAFSAHIAGDGPEAQTMKIYSESLGLKEHIQWLGWVKDTQNFYEGIDIACVSSLSESFGLVVLETWSHAKTLVSTRTSGPQDIMTHGKNGLLCDINPLALADALATVLQDTALAETLATQGHAEASLYSMAAVAPRLEHCLRTCS